MSTNKLRIQAYIETALYDQFEQERLAWGLSQSQALERILLERYKSSSNSDVEDPWGYGLELELKEIHKRLNELEKNQPRRDFPSEILNQIIHEVNEQVEAQELVTSELPNELELVTSELELVTSELPSELELVTSELPGELELVTSELPGELELVTSELPSELDNSDGITQLSLAQRLGCSDRYLRNLGKQGKLKEWSKEKDPQNISWVLRGRKYYPESPAIAL